METATEIKKGMIGHLDTAEKSISDVAENLRKVWSEGHIRMKEGEIARIRNITRKMRPHLTSIEEMLKLFDGIALKDNQEPK